VVPLEDLLGPLDVQLVVGTLQPGQIKQPVDVGLADGVFAGARRHAGQTSHFLLGHFLDVLGKIRFRQTLVQILDLHRCVVGVPQFPLDRLELLAQVILALILVDGLADLGLQLLPQLDDLQLANHDLGQGLQTLQWGVGLENRLFLMDIDVEVGGYEISQPTRIIDIHNDDLEFVGQGFAGIDDLQEVVGHAPHVGERVGIGRQFFRHGLHRCLEVRLFGHKITDADPRDSLAQQSHAAVGKAQHLLDLDCGADAVDKILSVGRVRLALVVQVDLTLGEGPQDLVTGETVVGQLDQVLVAQHQGHHHVGENNGFADGQNGQYLGDSALRDLAYECALVAVHFLESLSRGFIRCRSRRSAVYRNHGDHPI